MEIEEVQMGEIVFHFKKILDEYGLVSSPRSEFIAYRDPVLRSIACEFRALITGKVCQEQHVKYPENWWEAVKERFFPEFLLSRYPVKYKEVRITARELYPDIILPDRRAVFHILKRES